VYDKNGEDAEAISRMDTVFRIKGGWPAEKHEWPWIASIWNNGRQFCGGSLIGPNHILTAAHCIDHMSASDVPKLMVKLGDHNINSRSDAQTTDVKVANIIKHKGFSQRTLHNDVAILKLASPVKHKVLWLNPLCLIMLATFTSVV
jgi:secreted trypsin-like serine protease